LVIREQKDSLDNWINYLLSNDSSYLPMWAKVWSFQGMLHIGNLNENKDGYKTRSKSTVNPFVSFDSEILGKCVELLKESLNKKDITDEEIDKIVVSGSFAKLYGKLLANKKTIKTENDEGIWIKYNQETEKEINKKIKQGKDPEYVKLYNSLQGYNTGWCTAGSRETAKRQICGGDFYVYYTKDKNNEYKIPRIAIRMEQNNIGEIRGVAESQNIESNMEKILEYKLKEFPDAKEYQKKVSDMKRITEIYNKHKNKTELSKEELSFLYEIDEEIIGFGYQKDPRIVEILENRNKRRDLSIVLDCMEDEIGLTKYDLGNKIVFFFGNLDLYKLINAEGLVLPKNISGNLDLRGLRNANGLVLPQSVGGYLDLGGLKSAKDLVLPQSVGKELYLNGLTSTEGLVLPQSIGGFLDLHRLTSAEGLELPQNVVGGLFLNRLKSAKGLVLPQSIGGFLDLSDLTSAEGLELPQNVGGDLVLRSLTSAEGLELPQNVGGCLFLSELKSAKGLVLPQSIGKYLELSSLISAEDLVLPQSIGGGLDLRGLTSAKGLILPKIIGEDLYLSGLTSAEGLILPQSIGGLLDLWSLNSLKGIILPDYVGDSVIYNGRAYSLEQLKELQKNEETNIPVIDNNIKKSKKKGFTSNIFIIGLTILISIVSIFMALLIIGI